MKCICEKDCLIANPQGKMQHFTKGMVVEYGVCPNHFRPLEKGKINFATAGEEELLEAEYELDDLKEFIFKKYSRKAGNRGKERTIAMLLDCRYRALDFDPNDMV